MADSRVREAMAQAESIADNIAFQVNEAYRRLVTARLGIEDARPAVEQARENYRLVRLRAREGDATPTEITDAQASLTRAQQNYLNARVRLPDRDRPAGVCHGSQPDAGDPGSPPSLTPGPNPCGASHESELSAQTPPRRRRPAADRAGPPAVPGRKRSGCDGSSLGRPADRGRRRWPCRPLWNWVGYRRTPLDHRRRLRRGPHRQHRPADGLRADRPLPRRGERPGRAGPGPGGDRPDPLPRQGRPGPQPSSTRPGPSWSASRPTWNGSARRCRSRSRSPGGRWPRPTADRAKAEEALKLTRDEVEKGIDEARAGVKAARAGLTLAEQEYGRFTRLDRAGGQHPGTPAAGDAVARLGPGPGRPGRGQAGQGPGLADPGRRRPPLARGGADGGPRRRPRASTSRRSATTRSTSSSCWSRSRS